MMLARARLAIPPLAFVLWAVPAMGIQYTNDRQLYVYCEAWVEQPNGRFRGTHYYTRAAVIPTESWREQRARFIAYLASQNVTSVTTAGCPYRSASDGTLAEMQRLATRDANSRATGRVRVVLSGYVPSGSTSSSGAAPRIAARPSPTASPSRAGQSEAATASGSGSPSSSGAPQQTPANAHRFLSLTLGTGSVRMSEDRGRGFNAGIREYSGNGYVRRVISIPSNPVTSYQGSACSSSLSGRPLTGFLGSTDRYGGTVSYSLDETTSAFINWGSITDVQQSGGDIYLTGSSRIRFTIDSVDLATRVAFAMLFLKNHCDPTRQTGF